MYFDNIVVACERPFLITRFKQVKSYTTQTNQNLYNLKMMYEYCEIKFHQSLAYEWQMVYEL